ncbi:MAG: hypothetical protein JO119_17790 [Acidobacteria bacterium]|nr:hypothetical protein [Acidobacteriota bacterium]
MDLWKIPLSIFISIALVGLTGCSNGQDSRPSGVLDLRQYGARIQAWSDPVVSYNQIAFLSNQYLLVTLNQRNFTQSVELSKTDLPPSLLLLYDVSQNAVVSSTKIQVEKESLSIQPLANTQFLLWNRSGFRVCGADLACGKPILVESDGPILVSPGGTSFVVGGYGENQTVVASSSLMKTGRYSSKDSPLVPGDGAILLRREPEQELILKRDNMPEKQLPFIEGSGSMGYLLSSRFLNETTIGISEADESLLVADVEGRPLYRINVYPWYRGTALLTTALGKRFGVRDSTYTPWNSFIHFYDFNRPHNVERVRIYEVETARELFELHWDPRPYNNRLALPALSPDGHHLALIRHGSLELYDIP